MKMVKIDTGPKLVLGENMQAGHHYMSRSGSIILVVCTADGGKWTDIKTGNVGNAGCHSSWTEVKIETVEYKEI